MTSHAKFHIFSYPENFFQQNARLLVHKDSNEAWIIDPAQMSSRLVADLEATGAKVKAIILTHGHLDHVGGVQWIREHLASLGQTDVLVIGPFVEDAFLLPRVVSTFEKYQIPREVQQQVAVADYIPNPEKGDRFFTAGEELTLGDVTFRVVPAPGHAPGHALLISDADKLALVGDVVMADSFGRYDLDSSNPKHLAESISEHILPLTDEYLLLSGHGRDFTVAEMKQGNKMLYQFINAANAGYFD